MVVTMLILVVVGEQMMQSKSEHKTKKAKVPNKLVQTKRTSDV